MNTHAVCTFRCITLKLYPRVSLGIICVLLETVEIDSTAAEVHFDTIFDGVVDGSLGADAHFIRTSGFTNERASEKGEQVGENSETESSSPVKAKVDNPY